MYQARLVTCGCSQIPRVDLLENYSLVVNDVMCQTLPLTMIHFGYLAKVIDVKTALLYGDLEEKIYTECSHGMRNVTKDDCIILEKSIYSLVQAARQSNKKAIQILKKGG